MPHYGRERYFSLLKWIQKKTNPEGSAHQLERKVWSEVAVGGCLWQFGFLGRQAELMRAPELLVGTGSDS